MIKILHRDSKSSKDMETELKLIKLLQTHFPLGFNDNIYHKGNISKMLDFDVFPLLEIRKRKSRSHGIYMYDFAHALIMLPRIFLVGSILCA